MTFPRASNSEIISLIEINRDFDLIYSDMLYRGLENIRRGVFLVAGKDPESFWDLSIESLLEVMGEMEEGEAKKDLFVRTMYLLNMSRRRYKTSERLEEDVERWIGEKISDLVSTHCEEEFERGGMRAAKNAKRFKNGFIRR